MAEAKSHSSHTVHCCELDNLGSISSRGKIYQFPTMSRPAVVSTQSSV